MREKALASGFPLQGSRYLRATMEGAERGCPRAFSAMRRVGVAAILLVVLMVAAPVSIARADGDPASDYLLADQVFAGSESGLLSHSERQLVSTVAAANRAGFVIRVAVISSDYDLGSVTELWRQPRTYAHFLGEELSLAYRHRLLVVMPNGFGLSWPGHATEPAYRQLAAVPISGGPDGLSVAAAMAVRRLAEAAHVRLGASRASTVNAAPAQSSGNTPIAVVLIAIAVLSALTALALGLVPPQWPVVGSRLRHALTGHATRLSLNFTIASLVVLCAVSAVGAFLVLGHRRAPSLTASAAAARSGAPSSEAASTVVTPPPFSWPAGRRPAPDFSLRDQDGHPVSIEAYRGRPVIVTFIDPLCRNLCPLEAKVLDQAVRQLPLSQRPAVLAVSVDVYADARRYLLEDDDKWDLVPQWRWAVGSPLQLAAVWRRYKIEVAVRRERVAGRTIDSITHTSAAYVVDSTGHERALFFWPFYPQDVERVLRKLT